MFWLFLKALIKAKSIKIHLKFILLAFNEQEIVQWNEQWNVIGAKWDSPVPKFQTPLNSVMRRVQSFLRPICNYFRFTFRTFSLIYEFHLLSFQGDFIICFYVNPSKSVLG